MPNPSATWPRTVRTARCSAACISRETSGGVDGRPATRSFPVNKGGLCVKGWSAAATLAHPDRLRDAAGPRRRRRARAGDVGRGARPRSPSAFSDVQQQHGRDAVGVFGGGSLTNEKAYLLGKFARVALGTANIDYNGRFCMSSAAAAAIAAFGLDRGLPFPRRGHPAAPTSILLVGSNVAETMPPMMQYFEAQQRERRHADRRRSAADADRAVGDAAPAAAARAPTPRWPTACCTC